MANTSVVIGDRFDNFISTQIKKGGFASASDVVHEALRVFEQEEERKDRLVNALREGEDSGFVENFDPQELLAELHATYLKK